MPGARKAPGLTRAALLSFWNNHVVHLDVDLCHLEARQVFYSFDDVLAHGFGHLRDRTPVVHVHRYIRCRLPLADVYGETAGAAGAAREVVYELTDGGRRITRQPCAPVGWCDALYLLGRNPDDGAHHGVLYRGGAEIALEWV